MKSWNFSTKIWKSQKNFYLDLIVCVQKSLAQNIAKIGPFGERFLTPTRFYAPIWARMTFSFSNFLSCTRWLFQIFDEKFQVFTYFFTDCVRIFKTLWGFIWLGRENCIYAHKYTWTLSLNNNWQSIWNPCILLLCHGSIIEKDYIKHVFLNDSVR